MKGEGQDKVNEGRGRRCRKSRNMVGNGIQQGKACGGEGHE